MKTKVDGRGRGLTVPGSVIGGVCVRVPPVFVEHAVGEAEHLGEGVEPRMQQQEEATEQHQRAGHHAAKDGQD